MADGVEGEFGRSARSVLMATTRVEVIDHTVGGEGRVFSRHDVPRVTIDLQDEGRTLKVFLSEAVHDQRG